MTIKTKSPRLYHHT